ncbi:MAG: anaerobic sulfatase maturase [Bacteroidales bacterium]|nr:anaerobic sulfatase maturase [Bacteroidales bacterium]
MESLTREFQIFVKPVGAHCNMNCRYCYYLKKQKLYPGGFSVMTDAVLENYIMQHIEASTEELISFSWHGGEPMLAGIDFYRKACELQKKYKPEGRKIINGIQTNGTLINEGWCSLFSEENFMVGISIDGPGDLHNRMRIFAKGEPSLGRVIQGYEMLQGYGITNEILCVVSSLNVRFPLVVYDFFRQIEAKYITFLPLVEKRPGAVSGVSRYTVPSLEFGVFLSTIFDEWLAKDIGRIKIQIFEEALRPAFRQDHTLCIFKENCGGVPVLEHNGDFYSCDHYVDNEHFAGNISKGTIAGFLDSRAQSEFGKKKSLSLPEFCRVCEVKEMCNGECPKNRFIKTPEGEPGLNYLCSGYRHFFNHCLPFIDTLRKASALFSC